MTELSRVKIQGYRSIYDVDLQLGQLVVLTGPNNAGKTNVVESLDFLAEVQRHGLEVAVNRKGGIENISFRRMRRTTRPISFEIEAHFHPAEIQYVPPEFRHPSTPRMQMRHTFSMRAVSQAIEADYAIRNEVLELTHLVGSRRLLVFRLVRSGRSVKFSVSKRSSYRDIAEPFQLRDFQEYIRRVITPTDLLTETARFNPVVNFFADQIGSGRLYQLVPLECRRPGVPTPNADLDRYGSNLPAMVAYMQRRDPSAWQDVLEAMRRIIPSLEDVRTDFTSDRRLALQFIEAGVGRGWSSEDISDGTIQSLALFAALLDRRTPIVMVEEPENSTHPWIIRNFIDACRSARTKQVLLTTHSPVLISYLRPEDLVLVWRRDGKTNAVPLLQIDPEARRLWEEGKTGLFELLDSGILEEAVPGES